MERSELIKICEQAIVKESSWANRDSYDAQKQIGEAWVLLNAGCDFRVRDQIQDAPCRTDDHTIWIEIEAKGFGYFEGGSSEVETYYLPAKTRLSDGYDWY